MLNHASFIWGAADILRGAYNMCTDELVSLAMAAGFYDRLRGEAG